jgi:alpha-1,2-mannosyltransferase
MGNACAVGIPRAQTEDRPATRLWLWAIAVAAVAFLFRLVPVLRGGGLFGIGNYYDDGVYYAAATGLVHGRLPYQDFLQLHPPGITLLLAPFAAIAQLIGDSYGFAIARVAWMLLGAANAVLIWKIIRPIGPIAAVFGALGYAVLYPAVYVEKSTLLEGPATTALLIAMVLFQPVTQNRLLPRSRAFAAGALLGLAITIKGRPHAHDRFGVVTTGSPVPRGIASHDRQCSHCHGHLPTILRRSAHGNVEPDRTRPVLPAQARWDHYPRPAPGVGWARHPGTFATGRHHRGRSGFGTLRRSPRLGVPRGPTCRPVDDRAGHIPLITQVWFPQFPALTAAALAITVGAAIGRLTALAGAGPLRTLMIGSFAGALLVYACGYATVRFNRPFPDHFRAFTASTPGCVTSDDQTSLVLTDSLSRNLKRGCWFIADLGGHSHDFAAASGRDTTRNRNKAFQQFALDYLRSGSVTILIRYSGGQGFNAQTTAVLDQWPLLARSGRYQVRQPIELG